METIRNNKLVVLSQYIDDKWVNIGVWGNVQKKENPIDIVEYIESLEGIDSIG
jgi:hypothetical protein